MFKFKIDYNSFVQTNLNKLSFFNRTNTFSERFKKRSYFTEKNDLLNEFLKNA